MGKPEGAAKRPHGPGPPARALFDRIETIVQASSDLTWVELAKIAGMQRSTIYRLKTSKNRPLTRTVRALATALGMDPDEALELAGYPRPDAHTRTTADLLAAAEDLASEVETEIHRSVGRLGYRQQIEVLRYLRQMEHAKGDEPGASSASNSG